jgi:mono/diheme cytochrome c family protein
MTRIWRVWLISVLALAAGCERRGATTGSPAEPQAKGYGAAVVLISGEKQVAGVGAQLDQPVMVQVNDAKGAAVAGALVRFAAGGGVRFQPDHGLTGSDGQFTTAVSLGSMAGRYRILAATTDRSGKRTELGIDEIALGYQEQLGQQINAAHCIRCHDPESTPERVSNRDNLTAKAHDFAEGAVMNAMSDANLAAMISHGGAALNKSPEMPPYGSRLTKSEIDALAAYIRAVADPPYRPQGVFYASN